ncbi:MAG: GNAT family N-acetyltransferase, partial [Proteobacteria bacterium]|nr:GNAT family N-acetyltransferase [Pseudomonadota bacterium]
SAPQFLYHLSAPQAFDDFGLATRLSYFLWKSMPDTELFDAAREGRLSDPTVLAQQVDRMLGDPRSERFVRDFVGQAFRLYELRATTPDPGLYPEYDSRLGQAMARETELFLTELVNEDLGIGNLIDLARTNPQVRVILARIENKIAGFTVVVRHGPVAFYLHGGMRLEFKRYQPSALLLHEAIQWAQGLGCQSFNLMSSPAEQQSLIWYKEKWGAETREHRTYTLVLRPSYRLFRIAEYFYRRLRQAS